MGDREPSDLPVETALAQDRRRDRARLDRHTTVRRCLPIIVLVRDGVRPSLVSTQRVLGKEEASRSFGHLLRRRLHARTVVRRASTLR